MKKPKPIPMTMPEEPEFLKGRGDVRLTPSPEELMATGNGVGMSVRREVARRLCFRFSQDGAVPHDRTRGTAWLMYRWCKSVGRNYKLEGNISKWN